VYLSLVAKAHECGGKLAKDMERDEQWDNQDDTRNCQAFCVELTFHDFPPLSSREANVYMLILPIIEEKLCKEM
jgi:hypothetical protein